MINEEMMSTIDDGGGRDVIFDFRFSPRASDPGEKKGMKT